MTATKATKVLLLAGVFLAGFACCFWLKAAPHYEELETFFQGELAGRQVRGVSYFDYHGLGFFQYNRWKVVMEAADGSAVTLYQNQPVFQEPKPYQPEIEIKGSEIWIDDGKNKLRINVEPVNEPAK